MPESGCGRLRRTCRRAGGGDWWRRVSDSPRPIEIRIRNGALRDALIGALRPAAVPGDRSSGIVLTTEADTSSDACDAMVRRGRRVIVLMVAPTAAERGLYAAAKATCLDMGAPVSALVALIEE